MDPKETFKFFLDNWYWFMVGLYVAEKVVKQTKNKYDDIVFDMLITPFFTKLKEILGKK